MTRSIISKRRRRRLRGKVLAAGFARFPKSLRKRLAALTAGVVVDPDAAIEGDVALSGMLEKFAKSSLDFMAEGRSEHDQAEGADGTPLAETTRVVAVQAITECGISIPKGAVGTIVHVIRDGLGYDVEFTVPVHAVVAVTREEVVLSNDPRRAFALGDMPEDHLRMIEKVVAENDLIKIQ